VVLAGAGVPAEQAPGYTEALTRVLSREPSGKELLEAAIADSVYRQPSNRLLDARLRGAHPRATGKNFAYLFTWRSPAMGGKLGACHALDIPFVFRHLDIPEAAFLTRGKAPQSLSDAMSGSWASFAHTGTPDGAGLGWAEYGQERSTMVLDAEPRLEADPRREIREFFGAVSPLPER
jgi:para-nitrobenzyl esterase